MFGDENSHIGDYETYCCVGKEQWSNNGLALMILAVVFLDTRQTCITLHSEETITRKMFAIFNTSQQKPAERKEY